MLDSFPGNAASNNPEAEALQTHQQLAGQIAGQRIRFLRSGAHEGLPEGLLLAVGLHTPVVVQLLPIVGRLPPLHAVRSDVNVSSQDCKSA